jgi:hypothetical protein
MRPITCRLAFALVASALLSVTVWAQASARPHEFRGLKLFDTTTPKTIEKDVALRLDADGLVIRDMRGGKPLHSMSYSRINRVEHAFQSAPPVSAGALSAASTQTMAAPAYFAKNPRHWLTITSDKETAILRVSTRLYDRLKAAFAERNVKIEERQK